MTYLFNPVLTSKSRPVEELGILESWVYSLAQHGPLHTVVFNPKRKNHLGWDISLLR